MSALTITRIGVIDKSQKLHRDFTQTYLDYERDTESAVVYELYKQNNYELAVLMNETVDSIINEQMHLKYA